MAEKKKLNEQEFVEKAIVTLRKEGYKGIHAVYSKFNAAYKTYFNADPKAATERLEKAGVITIIPAKGGVMLYLKADAPASGDSGKSTLAKMGLTA